MAQACYRIIRENRDYILIEDLGPHDLFQTVTNAAEEVVGELATRLKDRRLYYIDSERQIDQLLVAQGKFAGFAPAPESVRSGR